MRIRELAQNYAQQMKLQPRTRPEQARSGASTTGPGFDVARQANQARVTDAGKGVTQATRIATSIRTASDGLSQARELVKQASDPARSPSERAELQKAFTKSLAAVDQAAKDQGSAATDTALTNKTVDPRRIARLSTTSLGSGASDTFASVAALKKLDLTTATPDQLGEALKVLDQARRQSDVQQATANAQLGRASLRLDAMSSLQEALGGTPTTAASAGKQQEFDAIQALAQKQGVALPPGSIFNTII